MKDKKIELLNHLEFGSVDSESEKNLDSKFIKTEDFNEFINPQKALILGAKGSGKSALFQMFSKYENSARKMAHLDEKDVLIVTGTGFNDMKELQTDDFSKLLKQEDSDFDHIWELYIATKIAIKLGKEGYCTGEHLTEFCKQAGVLEDFRILSVLKQLWVLVVGTPVKGLEIDIKGVKFKIGGKYSIDIQDMLTEINETLENEGMDCWILFDKIDELFSNDYQKRKLCIESLFRIYLKFVNRFPRIKFKIFLRTDIWSTLEFVNKSHISDKCVELSWSKYNLLEMLIRRILNDEIIKDYVLDETGLNEDEILLKENLEDVFYTIFAKQVYKGKREATVISWLLARITDGLGGKYPRELINFANYSKEEQKSEKFDENCLINGNSIKKAFNKVSITKCDTYLSEFPSLRKHFNQFRGKDTARYTRDELCALMDGLEPKGDDMIRALYETGMLEAQHGRESSDSSFEIPKLFRMGLGLVVRGRP
ncbi:P-loop ATPase, Sll1717 family [Holdemania filiformis]|uniref:P-loop ATPase, Sll1717 family n=1 Tax=Holdemania filiformis TaxID=61171 RepID=UPI0026709A1F|nr:hypothetical protein [Holdemania filiformis]